MTNQIESDEKDGGARACYNYPMRACFALNVWSGSYVLVVFCVVALREPVCPLFALHDVGGGVRFGLSERVNSCN